MCARVQNDHALINSILEDCPDMLLSPIGCVLIPVNELRGCRHYTMACYNYPSCAYSHHNFPRELEGRLDELAQFNHKSVYITDYKRSKRTRVRCKDCGIDIVLKNIKLG
jgi:hypothetical protein